jgi:hypothetical protein
MLSVIPLDGHPRDLRASQVAVSNSVAGPPVAVAVTPDHHYAIAVETFTQRPNDNRPDQRFSDLKNGRALTVVDISDLSKPRVVQHIAGLERPNSISINSDGSLVAVTFDPDGAGTRTPLALYRFAHGRLAETPATPAIPGWNAGDALSHAEFHPRENMLALLNPTRDEMSFVHVEMRADEAIVTPYGNTVHVDISLHGSLYARRPLRDRQWPLLGKGYRGDLERGAARHRRQRAAQCRQGGRRFAPPRARIARADRRQPGGPCRQPRQHDGGHDQSRAQLPAL